MSRSLKVDAQYIQTVKSSLKRNGLPSQRALAEELGMALSTISRFLNGKPVDYATFVEICDRLNLDWQTITNIADESASGAETPSSLISASSTAESDAFVIQPSISESKADGPQQDWGEAIDTSFFYGRSAELATLQEAILTDQCRLIAVLGIGGIGKTSLATKLAHMICSDFDAIIWRSVRNAPSLKTLLQDLVPFLSRQQDLEPTLNRLLHWLCTYRCLIILDNVETLLEGGKSGQYLPGYEDYGELFQRIGETQHRSCLLVTGREKPSDIGILESELLLTRSFQLKGSKEAAQAIVQTKGLVGSPDIIERFCQRYGENPLVIKIVGTSIQSIFGGDIALFLQENAPIFNDFRKLLDQQFERLSLLEQSVLYWLAINREWTTLSELIDDIWPMASRADVFDALESLSWRSLIEVKTGQYTQQPVVMEYMTDRLIRSVWQVFETLMQQTEKQKHSLTVSASLFCTHALLKATAKDYVRESQYRMILSPLVAKIRSTFIHPEAVTQYMQTIFRNLKQVSTGYGMGNFINLCGLLDISLNSYDFSQESIWQARLLGLNLEGSNFAEANFRQCQFHQVFGGITALTLNSDESLLAIGDSHGNIHLWQIQQNRHLSTFKGHEGWVFSLVFFPDGRYLVSCGGDSTFSLWDITENRCIETFEDHRQLVMSVALSSDSQWLASGSTDQTIKLWDCEHGQCLRTLEGHSEAVRAVSFSPTELLLASGSLDQTIKLWNPRTGSCLQTLEGHDNGVWTIDFSPDGHLLVSSGVDQTVRVWDINSGRCLRILEGHQTPIWSVVFSTDGQRIASGSQDGAIKIWHWQSGVCERTLLGHTDWLRVLVFSKNGKTLYSGSQDRALRLWDVESGQCLQIFSGYPNTIWTLAFSPDENLLVSGSHDQKIRFWDTTQERCVKTIAHGSPILSLSFGPYDNLLASAGGEVTATLKVWAMDKVSPVKNLTGHTSKLCSVAFHPHENIIASTGEDQTIRLWQLEDGSCTKVFTGHTDLVWSVLFSHDGNFLITGSFDCTVRLWSVETGECWKTLQEHTEPVSSVALSPNGAIIASTSADGTIKFWDVQTGNCLRTLVGHTNIISAGIFSPSQPIFASSGFDCCIKIWDTRTGECLQTLQGHIQTIWALAFSHDGQLLASSGEDSNINIWDIQSGECIRVIPLPGPYEGMDIQGVTGLSDAEITALQALGAVSA